MNSVNLIGRLVKNPDVKIAGETTVATFTVALDRPVKPGQEKKADFPRVTVFGKTAENCERYLCKGRLVGISGRLQTGSYTDRDGRTVYTTDVIGDRVQFLEWGDGKSNKPSQEDKPLDGFAAMSEDECPF